ncbi:catalase family peroxidase [Paenisporosarcina sp. TG-14]|uniref:catalase family peroxidase n=1 Tax=Paenisporosarcina sp. TG-14 TaxID=1231057 RepID=UPI0002FA1309|nr:catalase family peroxidase [Paenisporosarcina sp. TG-14]
MIEDTTETVLAKRAVNGIEDVFGTHPGYRRAHAKGELYEATFTPTGKASPYTMAEHLRDTEVQAIVRFSNTSPNPSTSDALAAVKGMSVQFQLSEGIITNLVGITLPIFVTKSPQTFLKILNTMKSFKDGKPNFKDMVKLFATYPESRTAFQMIRKLKNTKSYATGRYYAVHAFYLVNENGIRTPVKFEWEPEAGVETWSVKELAAMPSDFLEKEMINRLKLGEVRFRLHIVIGEKVDPTDDPTKEWPKGRQRIEAGILSVKSKLLIDKDHFIFDPTILPTGIECSNDEILPFRRDTYAISYERRKKEG